MDKIRGPNLRSSVLSPLRMQVLSTTTFDPTSCKRYCVCTEVLGGGFPPAADKKVRTRKAPLLAPGWACLI